MTPVVSLSMTGPLAGIPRVLNNAQGDHRWLIRFRAVLPDGTIDEREIRNDRPIPISLLHSFAKDAIDELLAEHAGEGLRVRSCEWTAYMLDGRRRKRPR